MDHGPDDRFLGKHCFVKVNFPVPKVQPGLDLDPVTAIHLNVSKYDDLKSTVYEYYADRITYFYRDAFSFGICVPSTCSNDDINKMLAFTAEGSELNVTLRKYCDSYEDRRAEKTNLGTHLMAGCLILLFVAVVLATFLYQVVTAFDLNFETKYLKALDIITNTKRLVHESENPHYLRMKAAEPIKGFAQLFAICGHALATGTLVTVGFCESSKCPNLT